VIAERIRALRGQQDACRVMLADAEQRTVEAAHQLDRAEQDAAAARRLLVEHADAIDDLLSEWQAAARF
jgi:hypothetical protein